MRKAAIPNLEVKVWTQKNELPRGEKLCSLTQNSVTTRRSFVITDIGYDRTKD